MITALIYGDNHIKIIENLDIQPHINAFNVHIHVFSAKFLDNIASGKLVTL